MYVLIAYDVDARRTEKYRKILARFLTHEQFSVFAGDLTASQHKTLRHELSRIAFGEDRLFELVAENKHNVSISILRKNDENGALQTVDHDHHARSADII